jgi:two-component system phosphate regulon response regulator PhoB
MNRPHVLVVDDEEDILELVRYNLSRNGFEVEGVASGEEALQAVARRRPDLVVLDLMLPGVDGLEVCRQLRQGAATRDLPVVMLTARGEEAEIVTGLELGADDYVAKPFSPRVLIARLKAVLRRRQSAPPSEDAPLERGPLQIHPGRHEVRVSGEAIELTSSEFRILHLLARRPGWVFTRQQIIDEAQGEDAAVTSRSVDVHVVSIRRKLGDAKELIETVRGVGYRFKDLPD